MAERIIPQGKKSYLITLTKENYEWLQNFIIVVCKQNRSQVSVVIDEMIGEMKEAVEPLLRQCKETGKSPSYADLLILLGKQVQKIGAEQKDLPL